MATEKDFREQLAAVVGSAVHFDTAGVVEAALHYYNQALGLLSRFDFSADANLVSKYKECSERSEQLRKFLESCASRVEHETDAQREKGRESMSGELQRAYFLMSEALDADEDGDRQQEALELYSDAVEVCLEARKRTADKDIQDKLAKVATQALERAEVLKTTLQPKKTEAAPAAGATEASLDVRRLPLGLDPLSLSEKSPEPRRAAAGTGRGSAYTEEEKRVLATTSMINGREYVPFLSRDIGEKFAFSVPYTDRHGKLSLAPKQKSKLVRWARPDEFMSDPKVVSSVDCFCVKQTVVSDCSFVASIAISAQYERKFGERLITSIIYPQDRKGNPVYNPCGKYVVRLWLNGVVRKIVVDDYFPLGPHNEPLCSYSNNKNELWVSLLEKAYMKVMGGYDFPGSNSNIDLYALTGWIPERESIRTNDRSFDKDELFRKLHKRFHQGDVLVTMATGEMSEVDADRAGLVPTHAYAMLDVREVDGLRLFLLKNPWSHLRWKGNYSEIDNRNWTPHLMRELKYDPKNAQNFDNGVFWIDYDSVCRFFDVVYMNWKPKLFSHTLSMHHTWNSGVGPAKDLYNISTNPQYSLELTGSSSSGALWILLSRHIMEIEDFKNNKEYITVLVYNNHGKLVYYPFDPPPLKDGIRINSPHYLCKMVIDEKTPRKLTLVVSQYEKSTTIHYSLRVYSSLPFKLDKILDPFKHKKELKGEWRGSSAGGCPNYADTYGNNPKFQFKVEVNSRILIELKGPKQFQVGFDVVTVSVNNSESPLYFRKKQSGPYRPGFVVLELEVAAGMYNVIPTTFKPGQESPFFFSVRSSSPISLGRL